MNTISKILCRTAGAASVGIALYDSVGAAKIVSKNMKEHETSKYLERGFYNARTLDDLSTANNKIQSKVFDLKTRNPIPGAYGGIKGGISGFFNQLGRNLPTIVCAAFALLSKGFMAKAGAISVLLIQAYHVARSGFGLGKHHPMD